VKLLYQDSRFRGHDRGELYLPVFWVVNFSAVDVVLFA